VPHGATRRGVLAVTAMTLPLLAGCKGVGALGSPPQPRPDVDVARRAIASESLLVAHYETVIARTPALAGSLGPLLAQHRDHLARLRRRLYEPRPPTPLASPSVTPVPGTPAAAISFLRTAEQSAATSLLNALAAVSSPSFAQLLASIAASEATHALVLSQHQGGT
jgi:Ferritin-like domain